MMASIQPKSTIRMPSQTTASMDISIKSVKNPAKRSTNQSVSDQN